MKEPIPQFRYVVQKIAEKQPKLAYLHLVEPRVEGSSDRAVVPDEEVRGFSCLVMHSNSQSLLSQTTSFVKSGNLVPSSVQEVTTVN